jgi:hypothetical protein
MAVYEVKKIGVVSMVKNFPIVFGILGAVIGIFTFFLFPTEIAQNLSFGARLLSWFIFVLLYTLIMVAGLLLISWLYNWAVSKVGGVAITLDPKEE